jgi:hypothetical protein
MKPQKRIKRVKAWAYFWDDGLPTINQHRYEFSEPLRERVVRVEIIPIYPVRKKKK